MITACADDGSDCDGYSVTISTPPVLSIDQGGFVFSSEILIERLLRGEAGFQTAFGWLEKNISLNAGDGDPAAGLPDLDNINTAIDCPTEDIDVGESMTCTIAGRPDIMAVSISYWEILGPPVYYLGTWPSQTAVA